ncbi:hypothetical protein BO94DRAFT_578011 [Aspergillus sclerotioniger CBS 115572]|uniref:Uncharacterized protein n=1 Tax=Aspergillus sclerotioniger CBS 115572 TaxID=1450535 RepID=A0A317VLS0_9EURO|nr:hypothetical protein BO94DRAFT_578011 [Aspergillus sclerotioniger CBS 115572]PWY75314.1 hypothetical protein BO94DRAFT_578011 [Aspergillus sclerotioniger CBS 115572]
MSDTRTAIPRSVEEWQLQWLPTAKVNLENLSSWRRYCTSFTTQIPERTFALARHYQLQVSRVEQEDFSGGGVLFTPKIHNTRSRGQAPQLPIPPPDFTKTPPSKPDSEFETPKFDNDPDSVSRMSSPRSSQIGDIKAIIEVKPVLRQKKEAQIRIQESHQIVASLLADYKSPIIQRRAKPQEIYISLAKYDDDYIAYLQTGGIDNNPFLVMHQFGPWDTNNPRAMAELGPIPLALTLKAQHY